MARPPDLYDQTVIYKVFIDSPGAQDLTSFDQALDLAQRFSHLTDGTPQVVYLVGWQHQGHDTGYPDVFTVNPRLDGREGLVKAMKKARDMNAILSLHDNYDDAYESSPSWDPDLVARDSSGGLMKGGVWAGGQSYIMSFCKEARAGAKKRVCRTLRMLPIEKSYHIDVLSAVPRRLDFNPQNPSSGASSLEGKLGIIREFNARGVDVTSEGFCAPFVGAIGHAWHLIRGRDVLVPGEKRIPFVPFVYHGHATYGGGRPSQEDVPEALLYGATFSADFNKHTSSRELTDSFYLLQAPFMLLRGHEMTGYREDGGLRRVEYGDQTYVEVDECHYEVVVDGRLVSQDYTSFVPNSRGDAWLAYSRDGGALDYPAPEGWIHPDRLKAVSLTDEGMRQGTPVFLESGRIRLDASPGVSYRIQRSRERI